MIKMISIIRIETGLTKESINDTSLFQEFDEKLQEILNLPMEEITAACPNYDFEKKCDCVLRKN